MKRLFHKTLTASTLLAGCLCFSQARAPQDPFEHLFLGSPLLIGRTKAWIVQEPKIIAQGKVTQMLFGPGPNEAVVISMPHKKVSPKEALGEEQAPPSPVEFRISVVSLSSAAVRQAGRLQASSLSAEWASVGRLLHLRHDEGASTLDLQTGRIQPLPNDEMNSPVISRIPHIALFGRQPWASRNHESAKKSIQVKLVDFAASPPRLQVLNLPLFAGNPVCLSEEGLLITHEGAIDLKTQRIKPLAAEELERHLFADANRRRVLDIGHTPESKGLTLVVRDDPSVRGARPSVAQPQARPFSRSSMKISEDARMGEVSESEEWVLFSAHGAGFALQLTPIDLDDARRALMEHAKKNALSFAKQAGTATMIYSADYDGCFPLSGSHARDALMPYLKNLGILDSVVWTNMTGQNSGKLENPQETILGYVLGPGGRAVLYADSHVVWVPDEKGPN